MVVEKDMIDFIAERCSPEMEQQIRRELEDQQSFASTFLRRWAKDAREALGGLYAAGEDEKV